MDANLGRGPPDMDANLGRSPPHMDANLRRSPPHMDANLRSPPHMDANLRRGPPDLDANLGRSPPHMDANLRRGPPDMDANLSRAAREGDVSELYRLIEEEGNVLKQIDEVEFTHTPLHTAADAGCIDFAMEIMNLKPSFARKLNHQGLSPIHLAVEKRHNKLVLFLVENDKDLVRVKGKNGETPLHYAITREENPVLLPRFLEDCPECIKDLTTENQTALHIAAKNNKEKALKLLCKMLRKTDCCRDVVNQKDKEGNTALHIAARGNQYKMIELLLKCKADKHAINLASLTALEVAPRNTKSFRILLGCCIPGAQNFTYMLQKQIHKYVIKASSIIFHDMDNISSVDRNGLLVILALLLTATYQASLNPPGSVWKGENSSDSTVMALDNKKIPGKSVMDETSFLLFYMPTSAVFLVTFFLTLGLLKPFPHGFKTALQVLLSFLAICFCESVHFLAPTDLASLVINMFSVLVFASMVFMGSAYRVSKFSVLILGCGLFSIGFLFQDYIGEGLSASVILGGFFFLVLYDEFLQGTILVLGYCLLILWSGLALKNPIIVLGCWLSLSLCQFCVKQINKRCCNPLVYVQVPSRWRRIGVE
ncbi:hypothetical protein REPUB_Repub03eG0203700 [Reevesia pubescens]